MLKQSPLIESKLANLEIKPHVCPKSEVPLEEHKCKKKQLKAGVFCGVKFISVRGTTERFLVS